MSVSLIRNSYKYFWQETEWPVWRDCKRIFENIWAFWKFVAHYLINQVIRQPLLPRSRSANIKVPIMWGRIWCSWLLNAQFSRTHQPYSQHRWVDCWIARIRGLTPNNVDSWKHLDQWWENKQPIYSLRSAERNTKVCMQSFRILEGFSLRICLANDNLVLLCLIYIWCRPNG